MKFNWPASFISSPAPRKPVRILRQLRRQAIRQVHQIVRRASWSFRLFEGEAVRQQADGEGVAGPVHEFMQGSQAALLARFDLDWDNVLAVFTSKKIVKKLRFCFDLK